MFSWLLKVPPQCTWDENNFLSAGPGGCTAVMPRSSTPQGVCMRVFVCGCCFLFLPAEVPICPQVICPLMSYWSSAGLAPSHHLGLSRQLFLGERYWISVRCQSFRKVMLDLISFRFALYAQWISSVQWAQSVKSPGQGAHLFCHHTLTWLYLIYPWSCKWDVQINSLAWLLLLVMEKQVPQDTFWVCLSPLIILRMIQVPM